MRIRVHGASQLHRTLCGRNPSCIILPCRGVLPLLSPCRFNQWPPVADPCQLRLPLLVYSPFYCDDY